MELPKSRTALVAVARFYLRPMRRVFAGGARRVPGCWAVRLGPMDVAGRQVVLRSPRMSDGPQWRAIRVAERERIEPWWVSSSLTWEQRHTEAAWVSSWLATRRAARAGRALPLVVEVDGKLAGQCGLDWIDRFTATGELGLWLDSRVGKRGMGAVATAALIDYAFGVLGLHRVTAPVRTDNGAASRTMQRAGLIREGTMSAFLDVGGQPRDHDLWAIVADRVPPGGMVQQLTVPGRLSGGPS
jgi:ribosomal-protein-alanine N-acetyltransferase